jgi:hypothetical protein
MKINLRAKIYLSIILLFINSASFCQLPYQLQDGRDHKYCQPCIQIIQSMPKEVLFGVSINPKGDVYFSISNKEWFDKIFKNNSYGISIDIVSKDRYNCANKVETLSEMPRGILLQPMYRQDMLDAEEEGYQNAIVIKVGKVPTKLMGKKLEGNIVILNGTYICYYTNFLNIDRSVWQLLPMGLFTDSLLNNNENNNDKVKNDFFTYSKKIEIKIPFEKASATFNSIYLKGLYDSLELSKYKIRKAEIRTYSSVEGPEQTNYLLMKRRADTIIKALKNYEPTLNRIKVLTAENWVDFFTDIEQTNYTGLLDLSKTDIKQKLTDKTIAKNLEAILSKQRKAFVTVYLESKTEVSKTNNDVLLTNFNDAIKKDNIQEARKIQKEIAERIMDNKIPFTYMSDLEVPETKACASLLSDREAYKYLLKATNEYEALKSFEALKKLDPTNGRINYNICALRFFMWQFGNDSASRKLLLPDINKLEGLGINKTLVKRMLINYQILKSEENMQKGNYSGKDSAVNTIRTIYRDVNWSDEDIYSIAKYYAYYAHYDWALEITTPRVDKLDVREDLVFYYVNLLFFNPSNFDDDAFRKATLNALNLNRKRFCNFFLPTHEGGAGMQLLEYETLKDKYCDACKNK